MREVLSRYWRPTYFPGRLTRAYLKGTKSRENDETMEGEKAMVDKYLQQLLAEEKVKEVRNPTTGDRWYEVAA